MARPGRVGVGTGGSAPADHRHGQDAYFDLFTKAAALLHSVANNHALVDGNKRLGWLATAVFLGINGFEIAHADNDDVYDLVIDVAAGSIGVQDIAAGLRRLADPPAERD